MLAIKEEVPKGHIRAFVEKFTGKDLSGENNPMFGVHRYGELNPNAILYKVINIKGD